MKTFLVNEQGAKVIDIPNNLEALKQALGWEDAWNTPTLQIGGRKYIVICSDTGKIRHEKISAISVSTILTGRLVEPFLVGPILITKFDGIDDFMDLDQADINILENAMFQSRNPNDETFDLMLVLD